MSTAGTASIIFDNTHGTEVNYSNNVTFINSTVNTGGVWFDLRSKMRRMHLKGNTFSTTYTGNTPFNLGNEVDGSDPQGIENYPFEQIVIEDNTFNFPATSHNHLFRPGVGADGGILRNNTFNATETGGNWGIILKASNWLIDHNNFYGPGPAIYITTPNNKITNNTLHSYDGNSAMLFYVNQDSIYGGNTGIPKNNYVVDNIIVSDGNYPAISHCDTSGCTAGAVTIGTGRTEEYWSNVIDNNIYWALDGSYIYRITANTNASSFTSSNTMADIQAVWQSSTYTNPMSLSYFNDISSGSVLSNPGIDGSVLDWTPSITGTGSVSGGNIGAYSITGGSGS